MSAQNERLARAWLALVPWQFGMHLHGLGLSKGGVVVQIDRDGTVWARNDDGKEYAWAPDSRRGIPALDSPANWGYWLAWTADTLGSVSLRRSGLWWSAESNSAFTAEHHAPAAALLELYCLCLGDDAHEVAREWWQHEQEHDEESGVSVG